MADIFISYKSERRAAAEHLGDILTDYGYSVWWDYSLVAGRNFGAQIERQLQAAKAVIVLWCSMSRESEWVQEEAHAAKQGGKLIPVKIEKVALPMGFSLAQTLNLGEWDGAPRGQQLDILLREVAEKVGRAPVPNADGLERTERAWRRFGAPSLRQFALVDPVERGEPPRKLLANPPSPGQQARATDSVETSEAASPGMLLADLRATWGVVRSGGSLVLAAEFLAHIEAVAPTSGLAFEVRQYLREAASPPESRPPSKVVNAPQVPAPTKVPAKKPDEPTMEEILASIQRIISEDEQSPSTPPAAKQPEPTMEEILANIRKILEEENQPKS